MRKQSNSTINITCSVVPSSCNSGDSNARCMRIAEIIQRDLSKQRNTSFLQDDQCTLPTLTQCSEYQSVTKAVINEG